MRCVTSSAVNIVFAALGATAAKSTTSIRCYSSVQQKYGIRKLLRFFYKEVHPDLTPNFSLAAKQTNSESLAQLNAYIDVLEKPQNGFSRINDIDAPLLGKTLQFFKCYKTRLGRVVPSKVSPIHLLLPSIRPSATVKEKQAISVRLIRDLEIAVEASSSELSKPIEIPPIITEKFYHQNRMKQLWQEMTDDAIKKSALYQPDDAHKRRMIAMKKFFEVVETKLKAKASRIKNLKKRKKKLGMVNAEATRLVYERFGKDPDVPSEDIQETMSKIKIIESGYHPDLLFIDPTLTKEQIEDGYCRVCGSNLLVESDVWLLEKVWKAMREMSPPIPVVIAKSYDASSKYGSIKIPYNFELWEFADFLEEHLEDVRERRRQHIEEALV